MKAGGRLAVAGVCILIGLVIGLAMHEPPPASNSEASPPAAGRSVTHRPASGPSTLWLLSVGVSRYRQTELSLRYADADALAIAALLRQQEGGPLYEQAKTLVLANEEASRKTILESLELFLGSAARDDVVVIFIAGHGVRDQRSGSYYFLPFPAAEANIVTEGLRMSDLDEVIRILRRRVRGVVVVLDTCHAGALGLSRPGLVAMDQPAAGLNTGEGVYLLAATKPGEQSQEDRDLGHGSFSYALLQGIAGAADGDGDGLISVADLFAHVAREVPRLTGGAQHPYYRIEGTDLAFVAVAPAMAGAAHRRRTIALADLPTPDTRPRNTIAVAAFRNVGAAREYAWIGAALRTAFNTELSKVHALRVYAPELLDGAAEKISQDEIGAARHIGIDRLITGSYSIVGDGIRIDAHIVDARSGLQEGSDSIEGEVDALFELQKDLVLHLLRRLRIRVSEQEGAAIEGVTNTDIDAYRLLLESEEILREGDGDQGPAAAPTGTIEPRSQIERSLGDRLSGAVDLLRRALGRRIALAGEVGTEPWTDIAALLQEYREALQAKDVDRLSQLYVSFPQRRRQAQQAYLDNASGLQVEIADVEISPHADGIAVSFTRRDRFTDRASDREVRLEVRLTRILLRKGSEWKIGGKP